MNTLGGKGYHHLLWLSLFPLERFPRYKWKMIYIHAYPVFIVLYTMHTHTLHTLISIDIVWAEELVTQGGSANPRGAKQLHSEIRQVRIKNA